VAGGAAQNAVRACQWLLQEEGATSYVGCVGKDEHGGKLAAAATADGVAVHYLEDESAPTGVCAVLIVDKDRSMVARLGAANNYKADHLAAEERQALLNGASFVHATGFFLTVAPDCLVSIGQHVAQNNKTFVMNVGAPFIVQFFTEPLRRTLPYVDVLVANETEAAAIGEHMSLGSDLKEIALNLAALPKENERARVVIFTRGADPAYIAQNGTITETSPTLLDKDKIVDLNGAGDSFCGGFIAGLMKGLSIADAAQAGHYVATVTIQTSGTSFTGKTPSYF